MPTLSRLEKLRNRRVDRLINFSGVNEVYERLTAEDESVQYAIGAMQPIDPDYTRRAKDERGRIEKQLAEAYKTKGYSVDFDYQGSLENDTHIRAHSDIDILTVDGRWHTVEPPNRPTSPYLGDTVNDLKDLRKIAVDRLKAAFPTATVDESGSKSINISGGSLRWKIDVVACGWWHTVEYVRQRQKYLIGIHILDTEKSDKVPNKPFLHNKLIDDRDRLMNGGLRKLIRLLKSLKYDSDEGIDLSSYDIAAIVFNMPDDKLLSNLGKDLILIQNCYAYLYVLEFSEGVRDLLYVPNRMRKIFCAEGASRKGLQEMRIALEILLREINQGMARSFRKLAEARVNY